MPTRIALIIGGIALAIVFLLITALRWRLVRGGRPSLPHSFAAGWFGAVLMFTFYWQANVWFTQLVIALGWGNIPGLGPSQFLVAAFFFVLFGFGIGLLTIVVDGASRRIVVAITRDRPPEIAAVPLHAPKSQVLALDGDEPEQAIPESRQEPQSKD